MRRKVLSAAVVAIGFAACSLGSFDDVQGGAAQGGAGGTQDGSVETSSGGAGGITTDAASDADVTREVGVVFDAESHGYLQGMGPISVDVEHTVGTEPNRILLVIVHVDGSAAVNGAKYAGVDLAYLGDSGVVGQGQPAILFYAMLAPPTGKHLVAVSIDLDPDFPEALVGAVSFHNVDQDIVLGTLMYAVGDPNTPIAVDIPTAPEELVLAGVTFRSMDTAASPDPGQTEVYSFPGDPALDLWGAASLVEGGEVPGWQHPDGPGWAAAGVAIHPPAP